jgi:hypothetical protein
MTLEKLSPIALFVYNRPYHTKKTIEYLSKNVYAQNSDLFIFSDSPKNPAEVSKVNEVRNYCHDIKSFKSIKVILREKNLGLAKNITDGISDILKKNEKVIVLEDDLLTDRYFLKYMNEALNKFKNSEDVISIHGYIYPLKKQFDNPSFLKGADCWGWATWKKKWSIYNDDAYFLLEEIKLKKKEKEFNFNNSYNYLRILKKNLIDNKNSWAIKWYASAFIYNKLTLYPPYSLIHNIGNDGSGTNSSKNKIYDNNLKNLPIEINQIEIKENYELRSEFENYFNSKNNIIKKILNKIVFK